MVVNGYLWLIRVKVRVRVTFVELWTDIQKNVECRQQKDWLV